MSDSSENSCSSTAVVSRSSKNYDDVEGSVVVEKLAWSLNLSPFSDLLI